MEMNDRIVTDGSASAVERERALVEQGKAAFARQDWKVCLDSYSEAIRLNPQSEAVELHKMAMAIIEFYNKDRFNP